jgi:hypothetical protein
MRRAKSDGIDAELPLAWLLRRAPNILLILGTSSIAQNFRERQVRAGSVGNQFGELAFGDKGLRQITLRCDSASA